MTMDCQNGRARDEAGETMATINNLAECQLMQIELMKWETRYAFICSHKSLDDLEEGEDAKSVTDLVERNAKYVARAWYYFRDVIGTATSKRQIILAWVAAECDEQSDAEVIYDELMASKLSIAKARQKIRTANGVAPKNKPPTRDRIKEGITAWMMEANYNLLDSEIDDLAVQIETALVFDARRGARKETVK